MKIKINSEEFEVIPCISFFSKFRGLMFSRKKNLLFIFKIKSRQFIHTFFVFFPITIIFLDEAYNVLEYKYIYPFQIYPTQNKAKYIIEIPKKLENVNKVTYICGN